MGLNVCYVGHWGYFRRGLYFLVKLVSIIRLDRQVVEHGGVCLYVKDGYSKYRVIQELQCCEEHEILWVHLRPTRLPRGYSCLVMAIVYHPDTSAANNDNIRDHLFSSLTLNGLETKI